MSGIEELTLLK